MSQTTTMADIHVRVNKNVKDKSEAVLGDIGISMSDLINMTLRQIIYRRAIPFEPRVPASEVPEFLRIESKEQLSSFLETELEKPDNHSLDLTPDEFQASFFAEA